MTVDTVFVYSDNHSNSFIYLHGPHNAEHDKLLKLYVDWYNTDFIELEKCKPLKYEDYSYAYCFCPIDFYDDYKDLKK